MKRFTLLLLTIASTLSATTNTEAAVRRFFANITHDQEPGNVPDQGSSGFGTFLLNDDDPLNPFLTYDVKLVGLDLDGNQTPGDPNDNVTRTHFHAAAFGVNGGIVFGQIDGNASLRNDLDDLVVDPVAGTIRGVWDNAEGNNTTLAAQLGLFDLDANQRTTIYFNVHTADHAGGEIRGQLLPVPEPGSILLCSVISLAGCAVCRLRRRN